LKITWHEQALKDYQAWQVANPEIFEAINDLIDDILRWGPKKPKNGRGEPKALTHELKGWWSRQITKEEHRLVYRIRRRGRSEPVLEIAQCHGHY
jgi:toxin YoeB